MEGGGCNGACGFGTAFQLTPGSNGNWQYGALYDFMGGSDGAFPNGGLIFDRKGNLYGTGVAAFVLTPNSGTWAESVICSFSSDSECSGGYGPAPGLDLGGRRRSVRCDHLRPQHRRLLCRMRCGFQARSPANWRVEKRVLHVFLGAGRDQSGQRPYL